MAGVFRSVAGKYDLMNDLMSFGLHRVWKSFVIAEGAAVRPGQVILDLAGGTGGPCSSQWAKKKLMAKAGLYYLILMKPCLPKAVHG